MKYLYSILMFSACLFSCIGKHDSDAQKAIITEEHPAVVNHISDTIILTPKLATIYWKGTKMRGAGKHEGTIDLKKGIFLTRDNHLIGGSFIVNMSSIAVTDIPEHEPIPRANLNNHLKSADFFDVTKYPQATFEITKVNEVTTDSLNVIGNLTIKDITKTISIGATYRNTTFATTFTFDRSLWDIAYTGSWADKTFVDKDVELRINITTK